MLQTRPAFYSARWIAFWIFRDVRETSYVACRQVLRNRGSAVHMQPRKQSDKLRSAVGLSFKKNLVTFAIIYSIVQYNIKYNFQPKNVIVSNYSFMLRYKRRLPICFHFYLEVAYIMILFHLFSYKNNFHHKFVWRLPWVIYSILLVYQLLRMNKGRFLDA